MTFFSIFKVGLAAIIISFVSWLSGKRPELAGYLTALPLVSIIAIAFAYWQHQDAAQSVQYAKSILLAIPLSCLFFAPFFFAEKLQINFWIVWIMGLILVGVGYFIHQWIMKSI